MVGVSSYAQTQTVEQLKKEQTTKKAEIAKLQGEVNALQGKIDAFPGWKYGAFGTIGAKLSGFNNWYSNAIPNSSTGNIGVVLNGYANLDKDLYFWRNAMNINLAWTKLQNKDIPNSNSKFEGTTDVFTLSSLFGYKLSETLAVSALGEYRTTFIKNFNNPGFLDFGIGATWTPIQNLVVVAHPLNYNYIFSKKGSAYNSSLGAKIVADYTRKIGTINFKSNFTTFLSYSSMDYSNWTWTNSFAYTLWKGIGVGFDFGLRQNKQEASNFAGTVLKDTDNKVQSFWLLGLSYGIFLF
ncbi:MAG: hypothetical protein CSA94_01980 [Bacteroidetes bacterium]|nr:MAG: hypothetical protein CSA94_01980 [Bacteroidota bacterium]